MIIMCYFEVHGGHWGWGSVPTAISATSAAPDCRSGTGAGKRRRLLVLPGMPSVTKGQLSSQRNASLQAASSGDSDLQWHGHQVGGFVYAIDEPLQGHAGYHVTT